MEQKFCQSCGMPLNENNLGANADGTPNGDYCVYCFKDGVFTQDFTMEQMIEFCAQFTDQINKEAGWSLTPEQAKEQMRRFFPYLKRWKKKDDKTLLIAACGLYCGSCRKFLAGKCPGCRQNKKASWCKIRLCCADSGFKTCAKCSKDVKDCKVFSNFIGKVFSLLFNSDRPACVRYIKTHGEKAYAEEMAKSGKMTMKRY